MGKTIVSWSGGVDSTAMVIGILEGHHPTIKAIDEIVMADTGSEIAGTYAFIPVFQAWLKARHGMDVTILRYQDNPDLNGGTLFDYCTQDGKERIPSKMLRWCTDKAKIRPISRYLKAKYAGESLSILIGFRGGEQHRIVRGINQVPDFTNLFPLGDMGIQDRDQCYAMIQSVGLDVPPHSACWFCPYRNTPYFKELACADPVAYESLIQLETTITAKRAAQGKKPFYLKHKPLSAWRMVPQVAA